MIKKNDKKDIDNLIRQTQEEGNCIKFKGAFSVQYDYCEKRGFSVTLFPYERNGNGICIELNPYDSTICSGLVEALEQDRNIFLRRMKKYLTGVNNILLESFRKT
jgi:hypothetical protein